MEIEEYASLLLERKILVRTTLTYKGWIADIQFTTRHCVWTYLFEKETDENSVHPKHFKTLLELYQSIYDYLEYKTINDIILDKRIHKYIKEYNTQYEIENDTFSCTST